MSKIPPVLATGLNLIAGAVLLASIGHCTALAQSPNPPARVPDEKRSAAARSSKAAPATDFERLVREANAARQANRLDDAIATYQQALRIRPSWAEGHWSLGTLYYELDRYQEARDEFRRVIAAQESVKRPPGPPPDGRAYGFRGLCEFQLKQYEVALADLLRAKERGLAGFKDVESVVQYHTAILMTRMEQYEFALTNLLPFAQQGNDNPKVIEAFGIATLRMPLLPSELPADRREMVLLAGRGSYYQAARLAGSARPAFDELVSRYPDAPNVHYANGVFLLAEDPDRALDEFTRELKRSPDHVPSMLQIAFEYIKRSDWEAARPWAQKAVEVAPDGFAGRKALGQTLFEMGDTSGAIEQLERGVRLAPDSPSLRFVLARAYQKAGRTADADREREEFRRLQRQVRGAQYGSQSVGGMDDIPSNPQ
jgi:tetratricopeptide (TPR) repeat protein